MHPLLEEGEPDRSVQTRGDRETDRIHGSVQGAGIGDRSREFNDPRANVDDYGLVNVRLAYQAMTGHLDLVLQARNLFDENAREPSPTAPVPSGSLMPGDFALEERSLPNQNLLLCTTAACQFGNTGVFYSITIGEFRSAYLAQQHTKEGTHLSPNMSRILFL